MPTTETPLRYPGGKSQLAPFVTRLLRENGLLDGHYVEPFAGGCGIAWKLLFDGLVTNIHINDVDVAIHAFWRAALEQTEALCDLVEQADVTILEWHAQRAIYNKKPGDVLALGFATLFLNRTNRSGILKGGVIGGLQQKSQYSLDCRFNKKDLVRKIRRIGLYKDQVHLSSLDARVYVTGPLRKLPQQSLVNIDPPYFRRGPELYCNFYSAPDHATLATAVKKIKQPWLLTYDDVPEIRALYSGLPQYINHLRYFAQEKRVGVELLVLDPRLQFPEERAAA